MNKKTSKTIKNYCVALYKSKLITDHEITFIKEIFKDLSNDFENIDLIIYEPEISPTNTNEFNLLLCIHDDDVLNAVREFSLCPLILCIELPGDHSYFSQITLNQLKSGLVNFLKNDFVLDSRNLIQLSLDDDTYYSLNDVHITSSTVNRRIRYDIRVDNESLYTEGDSANAILISTPTGSTAMSFNLGGAIIHPQAPVFQILSIASRNITTKHQIIPENSSIEIDIIESVLPLVINIDNYQVKTNCKKVFIKKASSHVSFIKFSDKFSDMHPQNKLESKLSFEDTHSLTSTAKFVLHVLQRENKSITINELIKITHIQNQKTLRSSLNLLMDKGFIKRRENLVDMREHLYYYSPIDYE
jgi:NAD kinase